MVRRSRILALVLAVVMGVSMLSGVVFADSGTATAKVLISLSEGEFYFPPEYVTVSSDLAYEYGYEAEDDGSVSVLDGVIAVHELLLGDSFTVDTARDFLDISEYGFVTLMLGQDASASSFFVNGVQPNDGVLNPAYGSYTGYTMDKAHLSDNDVVEVMFYQDKSYWSDCYSFFDAREASLAPDEELILNLSGYMTFFGTYPAETIAENTEGISDAPILIGKDKNALEATEYVTDENGNVTLSFADEGTYYISAVSGYDGFTYFLPPWCVVNVAAESPTPDPTAESTTDVTATPAATDGTEVSEISVESLIANISKSYYDTTDVWTLFDMVCGGYKTDLTKAEESLKSTIDEAYASQSIGEIGRDGLAIKALGGDLNNLTTSEGTDFDLIEKASSLGTDQITYVTDAIFMLLMYDCGDYTVNGNLSREALLEYILSSRNGDGIWGYSWSGVDYPDYDSTAMALNALAPYYGESAEVTEAVDGIISVLSEAQSESGTFYSANTDAVVIMGLTALGIDPETDGRFVKSEGNAVSGLLSYALADSSGFGYTNNTEFNAMATEQAFRALISYMGFRTNSEAYNVYSINSIEPIYGVNTPEPTSAAPGGSGGSVSTITVTVTVIGDTVHGTTPHKGSYPTWINSVRKTVNYGATAADVLKAVLTENGYTAVGIDSGYISSVTTPDGVTLSEYSNGSNSGWLYSVNDVAPTVGINSYKLKNGDEVALYFTDDYTEDEKAVSSVGGGSNGNGLLLGGTTAASSPTPAPTPNSLLYLDVELTHWAYDYIKFMTESGLIKGDGNGNFRPEDNVTRAEFVTILHRVFDYKNVTTTQSNSADFSDVSDKDWFASDVAWASGCGIVLGNELGEFLPNANITREDICVIADRAAELLGDAEKPEVQSEEFSDFDSISDYAASSVEKLRKSGVVNGKDNNCFEPQGSATRAEASKIIYLYLLS